MTRISLGRTLPPSNKCSSSIQDFDCFLETSSQDGLDPFTITQVFPYGGVESMHPKKGTFKVNGQRLKTYFSGEFKTTKASIIFEPP